MAWDTNACTSKFLPARLCTSAQLHARAVHICSMLAHTSELNGKLDISISKRLLRRPVPAGGPRTLINKRTSIIMTGSERRNCFVLNLETSPSTHFILLSDCQQRRSSVHHKLFTYFFKDKFRDSEFKRSAWLVVKCSLFCCYEFTV